MHTPTKKLAFDRKRTPFAKMKVDNLNHCTNPTHYTTSMKVIFDTCMLISQFGVVYSDKKAFLNLKMFIFSIYGVKSRQLQGE